MAQAPKSRLSRLPRWISHWLGYRDPPPNATPAYVIYFWSFIGAFCGLSTIQSILYYAPVFVERHVALVASFGAGAVLCYGSIDLPLAQPRNVLGSQILAAVIGVCFLKLFALLPADRFEDLRWLSSSLSTAVTIVAMQATKTTHPPAGATALIPILEPASRDLGWYYIPVVLLCAVTMLATALLLNNIQRRYPAYWITPSIPPASIVKVAGATVAAPGAATAMAVAQGEPTYPAAAFAGQPGQPPVLRLDEFTDWYRHWNKASLSHDSTSSGNDDDDDMSDKV